MLSYWLRMCLSSSRRGRWGRRWRRRCGHCCTRRRRWALPHRAVAFGVACAVRLAAHRAGVNAGADDASSGQPAAMRSRAMARRCM